MPILGLKSKEKNGIWKTGQLGEPQSDKKSPRSRDLGGERVLLIPFVISTYNGVDGAGPAVNTIGPQLWQLTSGPKGRKHFTFATIRKKLEEKRSYEH